MRRASFFLSLAAGLVASLALSAPTQAGSVKYDATSFVYVYTNHATDATVEFNQAVTGPVTILPGTTLSGITDTVSGSTVTFNFNSVAPGTYDLNFSLYSTSGLVLAGGTVSGTPLPMGGVSGFVTSAVPEPTSMALLGIGMAGFFAYRRLFRRPATA
jgi:hypothetical protein